MSSKKQTKKSLRLLEKLVQENGEGETNSERQILYDNLIKETGGGSFYEKMNGNYVDKNISNENGLQRKSRQRVRKKPISQSKKNATKTEEKERISIPLADSQKNGHRSRSNSRSSTSSFWSSRSRSRSRSPSNRSRSRSVTPPRRRLGSRSPTNRSRSRSVTPPRRRLRSQSPRSSSRSRSRSLSSSKSRSSSQASSHSVPTSNTNQLRTGALNSKQKDMSEQGSSGVNNRTGKKKKLLHRSPMRKFRSLEINPDLFIEEKLNRKYQELNDLVQSSFGDTRPQVTRKYLYQMEVLRDQYKKVSHGLPPSGLLLPADIPSDNGRRTHVNKKRKGRTRPQSANSAGTSSFGEDKSYGTIYSVMTGSIAREQNFIRSDIHAGHCPRPKSKRKNLNRQKRKDSQSTVDTHDCNSLDKTPSGSILSKTNSSPRSHMPPDPTDHHVKYSNNPKLLSWLKKKDTLYRKQKKEEKMKKRDEREKAVMDANEKFERRLESQKKVKEWMDVKKKEGRLRSREERRRKKEDEAIINNYHLKTTPGAALKNEKLSGKGIRPQSAPSARKGHSSEINAENTKNGEMNAEDTPENIKERIHKIREEEEEKKQNLLSEKMSRQGPHPPASKFVYKRPVAGRIRLNIRPKSATTAQQDKSKSPERGRDSSNNTKARMSYDDWLNEKRKQDQLRKAEIKWQKEELAKSDPELAKIIPDIAKKRIHQVLEGKKSIDTGIKRHDEKVNNSFGGGNFNGEESDGDTSPTRFSYRLEQDRPASSRVANPKALKVAGQGMHGSERPQTAPPRSSKVPSPKISSSSPRKAVVPAKSKKSDEVSSAFKPPFPEEEGVPKHVASVQRKLFAEKVWAKLEENEERPEPQGCDSSERPVCPPTNDNVKSDTAKSDSVGKVTSEEIQEKIPKDTIKAEEMSEEMGNGDITTDGEKQELDSQEPGYAFFVTERTEDQVQEEAKTTETVGEQQKHQMEDVNQRNTATAPLQDDFSFTLRPESSMTTSRSAKHVSFCEETEILGTQEEGDDGQVDWSTDTATPDDEDYATFHAQRDLGVDTEETLDSFGQELNNINLGLPGSEAGRAQTLEENKDFENKSSSDEDSSDEEVISKEEESFEEKSASPNTFETDNKVKDSLDDEF